MFDAHPADQIPKHQPRISVVVRAIHHFDLLGERPGAGSSGVGLPVRPGRLDDAHRGLFVGASRRYVLFLEHSPEQLDEPHDRLRPGVNHLAFTVDTRAMLDGIRAEATANGWCELFADRYPHAGGEQITALYLENSDKFELRSSSLDSLRQRRQRANP